MEFKNEHIIVIVLILVIGWMVLNQSFENFNVIENRWAYPLTNEAGNLWTKEFDRPVTYSYPDGRLAYIPQPNVNIPKNPYKEEIYDGKFEIPQFNYEDMPIPKKASAFNVDETEGDFLQGVSYDKMPDSDSQQHYVHLKRQMQTLERGDSNTTENFTDAPYEYNDQQFSTHQSLQPQTQTLIPTQMQQIQQIQPPVQPQMQQMPSEMQQMYQQDQQAQQQDKTRNRIPRNNMFYIKGRSNSNVINIVLILILAVLLYYIYSKK